MAGRVSSPVVSVVGQPNSVGGRWGSAPTSVGLSTGSVFCTPLLFCHRSTPLFFVVHRTYIHTSAGRIFGVWFSYFHTTCNSSSAPPSHPRPIHATPSAATNSRLRLRLRLRLRRHRRRRRRRCNLRHRRRCHRLTATIAFAATFSFLYFS